MECSVVWWIIRPGRVWFFGGAKKSESSKLSKIEKFRKFWLFKFKFELDIKFDEFGFIVDGAKVVFDIVDFLKPFLLILFFLNKNYFMNYIIWINII